MAGLKLGAYINQLSRCDLAEPGHSMLRPYNGSAKATASEGGRYNGLEKTCAAIRLTL
jgi:hypothetical protein